MTTEIPKAGNNFACAQPTVDELSVTLLKKSGAQITPLLCGLVLLDIDVFGMDNNRPWKEGVSRTYGGHDGYVPPATLAAMVA